MNSPTRIRIGSWIATPALNLLEQGEQSIRLEARAMDVLALLARRAGEVIPVEELLGTVWQGVVVSDSSAYQAIKQLRQALGDSDGADKYIETIPKRGYRLIAPVEMLAPATSNAVNVDAPAAPARPAAGFRWAAAATIAGGIVLAVAWWLIREPGRPGEIAAPPQPTSFTMKIEGLAIWDYPGVAVSPDGRYIAYTVGASPAAAMLYVRPRDAFEARLLPGTEGARVPFWSPDSNYIGFRSGDQIKSIALAGGGPQVIADVSGPPAGTMSWGTAGDILYDSGSGIMRVAASGSDPVRVTTVQPGEILHAVPHFLPDGRRFLYTAISRSTGPGTYVQSLDSPDRKLVIAAGGLAAYASGHLLLAGLDGALTAQPFDLETLQLSGSPQRLTDGALGFSVSTNGVLAYKSGPGIAAIPLVEQRQLAWYDRRGQRIAAVGEPGTWRGLALSRDGRHVAVHRHDGQQSGDIWVLDLERGGVSQRLTFDPGHNFEPAWSPDGRHIIYTGSNFALHRMPVTGASNPEALPDASRYAYATDWSGDGDTVLLAHVPDGGTNLDISALSLQTGKLVSVLATPNAEGQSRLSPDGRWLAYLSNESGAYELYARKFPQAERATRISTAGAVSPLWSASGKELFYLAADGAFMVVATDPATEELLVGEPRTLFKADIPFDDHPTLLGTQLYWPYAVSPDGQRFLVSERAQAPPPAAGESRRDTIAVVVDWPAGLRP